jgi:osmotically-inducible protein OsmY
MNRRQRNDEWRESRDRRPVDTRGENFAGPGGYSPTLEHSDYGFQGGTGVYGDYGGADRFTGDWRNQASPWMPGERDARGEPAVVYSETWVVRGPHTGKGPQGYRRSDARIQDDVCETLSRHGELDASDIEVRVRDGVVELHGYVDDRRDKYLAEDLAENVLGVSEVLCRLRVRKSSRSASYEKKFRDEHEHDPDFDRGTMTEH